MANTNEEGRLISDTTTPLFQGSIYKSELRDSIMWTRERFFYDVFSGAGGLFTAVFGIFAIFVGSYNGFAVEARLVREFYNYRSARTQAGIMDPAEAKAKMIENLQEIQKPRFGCMTYLIWLMPGFLRPLCCCRAEKKNFKKMQVAMERLHAEFDISKMIIDARADALFRKANMKPHQIEAASFSRMFVIGDEDIEPTAEGPEELPESRLPSMALLGAADATSFNPSEDPVDRQLLKDISGVRLNDAIGIRDEETERIRLQKT